jgi:hypothetical protein
MMTGPRRDFPVPHLAQRLADGALIYRDAKFLIKFLSQITQATRATFTDLYFQLTVFFFIQRGNKYVLSPRQGEILGGKGDLLIFPPGSMVTMENRPVMEGDYQALGVCYAHNLIDKVFSEMPPTTAANGVQIVRATEHNLPNILSLIQDTLDNNTLPDAIRDHRLLEPLLWLREQGFRLPT